MTDSTPPIPPDSSFGVFDCPYVQERKAKCRQWQERALQGDTKAIQFLREIGLTRWERNGRRVL